MKFKNILFLTFLLLFLIPSVFSQTETQQSVALTPEDKQSMFMYETMLKQQFSNEAYNNLLLLYQKAGETKNAQKLIQKTIKQFPDNPIFSADLGFFYLQSNDNKKADKQFSKTINSLKANNNTVVSLANYFSSKSQDQYAIQTYKKARELFSDKYRYMYELSFLYQRNGNYDLLIDEYFSLLEESPASLNQIKINLGNLLAQTTDSKLNDNLRKAILKNAQQNPSNQDFSQLYLWFLLQEKEYSLALNQAKSIDKRFEQKSGESLFLVSSICLNNKAYAQAKEGFEYIIEKGKENPYYNSARQNILSAIYYPFIEKTFHTNKENEEIKTQYSKTLSLLGESPSTLPIMQQYAYLLAYYLNEPQQAVDILDSTINLQRIKIQDKAQSKLMRADIYLMNGDVWEASLTYSQVEKELKNDVIGSEAKFKNAMLSYYSGDFEWAYSQFVSLRSSTEKLIANDAMEESLLINENMDEDSSYNGLKLYSKADFALYCHKYDLALAYLDTINQSYLSHPLFDEVLYMRAQIAITKQEYQKANSLLNLILLKYPTDLMADDAVYLLAQINETYLSQPKKAKEYYEKIILDYPESLYVTEARKKLNHLQ